MIARLLALLLLGVSLPAAAATPSYVIRDASLPSPALGRPLHFAVYLPPDYARGQGRLPVVYLLHGAEATALDWVDQGHVRQTADRLITSGRLPPLIIVMPDGGPNSWYMDAPVEGSGNIASAIARDLPAYVEAKWQARHDRGGRAIAGYSMGGYGALRFALSQPERYVAAAAMSGAFWTRVTRETRFDETIQRIFAGAFGRPFDADRFVAANPMTLADAMPPTAAVPQIYLTCGRGDRFHLDQEQAVMAAHLTKAHIPVTEALTPGDHDWATWSAALPAVLEFLASNFTKP